MKDIIGTRTSCVEFKSRANHYSMEKRKIAVLGSSRGLGAELARVAVSEGSNQVPFHVLGVARKTEHLSQLKDELGPNFSFLNLDLSKEDDLSHLEGELNDFMPSQIFYVAGGGPYGAFGDRPFHSHQWAWRVTYEAAARICHYALRAHERPQVILIGSAICESQPDLHASSYAAAKHAVKGLYTSLRREYPDWDLRLFSPGYLDTELLPKNAQVRYKKLWEPKVVAHMLFDWSQDKGHFGSHRVLSDHP